MPRNINTVGGGSQTNSNGLKFEQSTLLDDVLREKGYIVKDCYVYSVENKPIGMSVHKKKLYSEFLEKHNLDYRQFNSKGWEPDDYYISFKNKTAYIIEKKFQKSPGSVDEKLATCHFKLLEYQKLFSALAYKTTYIFVLSDWFKRPEYRDVLAYINLMGCFYFFNEIPLDFLGL